MALAFSVSLKGREIDLGFYASQLLSDYSVPLVVAATATGEEKSINVPKPLPKGYGSRFGYMAEMVPGAFDRYFGASAFVYTVSCQDFDSDPRLGMSNDEFICRHSVPVQRTDKITNVWTSLNEIATTWPSLLKLVKYADRRDFFKKNGIPASTSAIVIHVTGVRGSGKSWIYDRLMKMSKNNVEAIECDNVYNRAYWDATESMGRENPDVNEDDLYDQVYKNILELRDDIIYNCKAKVLVFCGITVPIEKPDHGFFIEIDEKDMEETYRRLVSREFKKPLENQKKIKKMIKGASAQRLGLDLNHLINKAGILPSGLGDYKEEYAYGKRESLADGYSVLKQEDILAKVKALIKEA